MKNSFLTKYDIVELLGLNLTSEEKERYLEELSDTCVKKAFYRLYREGKIEEELFNKIEPTILSDDKDYDITQEIGHLREELDEAIIIETNDYKKLSLLEQIEKFSHYITKKGIQDSEIEEILTKLTDSLNRDGEDFGNLLNLFKQN